MQRGINALSWQATLSRNVFRQHNADIFVDIGDSDRAITRHRVRKILVLALTSVNAPRPPGSVQEMSILFGYKAERYDLEKGQRCQWYIV